MDQEIVDYLKGCGVCQVCQLRYLKIKGKDYCDPQRSLEELKIKEGDAEEATAKKPRRSPCPLCLGLFSAEFQEQLVEAILATDINQFDCNDIVVAISTPMLLQIRQLSMWYALLRKFGNKINIENPPDIALKEAIKLIINPVLCEKLKKNYDANGIMINITLSHSQEIEEVRQMNKLNKANFSKANGKVNHISRGVLEKQYTPSRVRAEIFEEYLPIPPQVPTESLELGNISLTGPTLCIAGRYRKISRELSHTPWILNGKRVMEDSIEEVIIRNVAAHFCPDSKRVIFMSSGREDVNVRCLGKGRPFVLEIPNCQCTQLSKRMAHEMELRIDASSKVSVRNLQIVPRDELVNIKTGEEKKRKYYRALCKLNSPATQEVLVKLNALQRFEIQQKTPLRVLHRRPLHTRPRMIYSLKAYVQRENLHFLVLDIVTQAGTYIKELVHGEFGRTVPSIASIINQPIDIVALDVVGIDLDWPLEVDNSTE